MTAHASLPYRIAHLGNLGCGGVFHRPDLLETSIARVNALAPDLVVVAGDLTADGYVWEYEEARRHLDALEPPLVVVPGNRDARNVGYIHFERIFGARFTRHRQAFDDERRRRLGLTGVTVLGVDSSQPDVSGGHIGREWYDWVREQYRDPDDLNVFVLHHHLVAVPGAGRAMNVVTDAGDLLPVLHEIGVDVVLSGHKHVPYFWGLNGMLVANCGTVSTRRLRGRVPASWTSLVVDHATVKAHLHYEDGRAELCALRDRSTRQLLREVFHVTADFHASNHVPVH